jgi:geranylgeranyl pyrophosphate synthase
MNNYFINIEKYIINKYINKYPIELKDKILYLLQNGKRLRPILFLIYSNCENIEIINTANNIVNITIYDTLYTIAICIELIHSLSLVLDDLPEMDNDNIRRDNDSFHIKYGIEYTNFFIYYMFNNIGLELDNCFDNSFNDNEQFDIKIKNITIINDIKHIINLNMNLLIDGQYNDLEWNISPYNSTSNNSINIQNSNPNDFLKEKDVIFELLNIDNELINYITTIEKVNEIESNIELNMKKTSSLFNLSITSGYILQLWKNNINYETDVNNEKYKIIFQLLNIFSNILGYMFQISDDLLDIQSDLEKNKPNICAILDKDIVSKLLKNGCNWLYVNNKNIYQLMGDVQDLENSARKNNSEKVSFNIDVINKIIDKIENRIK